MRRLLSFALGALALFSLASWFGEVSEPLALLEHLRLHMALGAAILLLGHLFLGQFWPAVVAALLLSANLAGSVLYPHRAVAAAEPGAATLAVLVFNTRWGADNTAAIAELLRDLAPDFAVLTELTPVKRDGLAAAVGTLYPWRVDCSEDIHCRVAILSRHRWQAADAGRQGADDVAAAWADFGPELGNLRLIGTHLSRPWPWWDAHRQQVDSLVPLARVPPRPVAIAGDFNATPWSRTLRVLRAETGLLPAGWYRPTWPLRSSKLNDFPLPPQLQLDQVLVPEGVQPVEVRIGPDLGSDHLPITVRVTVPRSR